MGTGSCITSNPGERLIEHGKPVESISLIRMRVTKEAQNLGELEAEEIVGSALLLSGAVADLEAVTVEASRSLRWEAGTLDRYLNAHPDSRHALQRHLSRDSAGAARLGKDYSEMHRPA